MQNAIKVEIKKLAKRVLEKQKRKISDEEKYRARFLKRTDLIADMPNQQNQGFVDRHFDPRYCARNANFLANTIWHKVVSGTYEPRPAIQTFIPKPDGSKREIMAFTIPDAALANVVLHRTRDRNIKRFSPYSYAYHPEKNVFDALLTLKEFEHNGKLFAVQIDFEKYFDLIPSSYLCRKLEKNDKIRTTVHEQYVFRQFLNHRFSAHSDYQSGVFKRRHRGTPQGSSVSLFLANLANDNLDTALSAEAGQFTRFADDVVALCSNYSQAQRLEGCFARHCKESGLIINNVKSPGISIISNHEQEIRSHKHFDYLGYRFEKDGLSVPEKSVNRIQSKIARLINIYLIEYLDVGFRYSRTSLSPYAYDWDLLGLAYELRRSLYGGLSEEDLSRFIYEGVRLKKMKGLMGFYCLLDNPDQLRHLDGWMLSMTRRAMVKRNQILVERYGTSCPTPSNAELATGVWLNLDAWTGDDVPEVRMPSLMRGWRAARKYYYTFGLGDVEAPSYGRYSDIGSLFEY